MNELSDICLVLIILFNFYLMGSSRLLASIKMVAAEGALLALLPLSSHGFSLSTILLAISVLLLKGVLIPVLLVRAIKEVRIRRDMEPIISYIPGLVLCALGTAASFFLSTKLPLIEVHQNSLYVPVAFATMFTGLLLLVGRRKAITHVLGYLVFENGIYIFSILLQEAMPIQVEAGILLDLLVAVFVMGIVLYQINQTVSTISEAQLAELKE